jgi:hypothetical protein
MNTIWFAIEALSFDEEYSIAEFERRMLELCKHS